jgi:hypothetical protein
MTTFAEAEPNPAKTPPTFAYIQREERRSIPAFTAAPAAQYNVLLPELHSWQEAPDPIRQSDFWAAGNKIHAWAHMFIPSSLAIGVKESVMQDTFEIGKLLGYIHAGRQQYAGAQQPSILRTNIEPAIPATYGSQYEVRGMSVPGNIMLATGMSYQAEGYADGYPY